MFEWMITFVGGFGLIAVALLMFAENVFPPIPSELIMPMAGFAAARGEMNLTLAIVAGSVGSLLGALLWYYIGYGIGEARLKRWSARHGRWLAVKPKEIDLATGWFEKHGRKAVLVGRMVPAVRTFISVPAGVAGMNLVQFLVYSAIGTVIWNTALASAGYLLENRYDQVAGWIGPVSNVVIAALVLIYVYRVVTFNRSLDAR